jgi:hypothetical protein
MSKKLLIGLAPLLAIAAFAVAPTVAQATPHYFKNLVLSKESEKVPYVSWGTLSLESKAGKVECENTVGGFDENPAGGGAGKEETDSFYAYNCKNAACTGAGGKIGVIFENEAEPGPITQLKWPGELIEPSAGLIRLKSENVRVFVRCEFAHLAPSEKEGTTKLEERTTTEINAPGAAPCTSGKGGSSEPEQKNGSSTGKPSKTVFDPGAGELECGAVWGKGKTGGTLKAMGYKESELLTSE